MGMEEIGGIEKDHQCTISRSCEALDSILALYLALDFSDL